MYGRRTHCSLQLACPMIGWMHAGAYNAFVCVWTTSQNTMRVPTTYLVRTFIPLSEIDAMQTTATHAHVDRGRG